MPRFFFAEKGRRSFPGNKLGFSAGTIVGKHCLS